METCAGCGAKGRHPMVAVVRDGEGWKAVPVCAACHKDPAHRTTHIKGHFFEREGAAMAVRMAGSNDLGRSFMYFLDKAHFERTGQR